MSMSDAQEKLESWRRDYNEQRPNGAVGNKTPVSLAFSVFATSLKSENQFENPSQPWWKVEERSISNTL